MVYSAMLLIIPLMMGIIVSARFQYMGKEISDPKAILKVVDKPGEKCDRNPHIFKFDFTSGEISLCNIAKFLHCNYLTGECECIPYYVNEFDVCRRMRHSTCKLVSSPIERDNCIYGTKCLRPSNAPAMKDQYGLCCANLADCVHPAVMPASFPPLIGGSCNYDDYQKIIEEYHGKGKKPAEKRIHERELLEHRKNPKYLITQLCFDPELEFTINGHAITKRFAMKCTKNNKCICNAGTGTGENTIVAIRTMCLLKSDLI